MDNKKALPEFRRAYNNLPGKHTLRTYVVKQHIHIVRIQNLFGLFTLNFMRPIYVKIKIDINLK